MIQLLSLHRVNTTVYETAVHVGAQNLFPVNSSKIGEQVEYAYINEIEIIYFIGKFFASI